MLFQRFSSGTAENPSDYRSFRLWRYDNTSVNAPYNASRYPISSLLEISDYDAVICKARGFIRAIFSKMKPLPNSEAASV